MQFIKHLKPIRELMYKYHAKRQATNAFRNPDNPPVLIYQMGKVGSMTVYNALENSSVKNAILHIHFLSPDLQTHRNTFKQSNVYPLPHHIYLGEAIQREIRRLKKPRIKIISLLRDPIAFVLSDIFQNPHFTKESVGTKSGLIDPQKALKYLEQELRISDTFAYVYEWFDREIKHMFDIDVLSDPFAKDSGVQVYYKNKVKLLLIRLENLTEKGPKAIQSFLDLDNPLLLKARNERADLNNSDAYKEVKNKICLNRTLCEEIYSSKFVQHFYDQPMIDSFIAKWSKCGIF